jgi:hypothetical protein
MSAPPRQFDTVLRWFVPSRTREHLGVEHLVDLQAFGGNGSCTCEHFSFKLSKHLQSGVPPGDDLRCHHIQQARAALSDLVVAKKAKEAQKP